MILSLQERAIVVNIVMLLKFCSTIVFPSIILRHAFLTAATTSTTLLSPAIPATAANIKKEWAWISPAEN